MRIVQKRLSRNQDARIIVGGEGGVGKSTWALRIGEIINPSLYVEDIDRCVEEAVAFTAKQYMFGVETLPSLTLLDFDEPAQAWYHRQFMSEVSQILSKTMIGFRFKKFVSVLNVPNIDLLDIDALRLVNWLVWIPDQGIAEVYRVLVQKFGGPPRYKKIIDKMTFSKPSPKLWHRYEEKKFRIQDDLYKQYGKRLTELESPHMTNTEIIDAIKLDPKPYQKYGKLYVPYLQQKFGVGLNRGYLIKAIMETENEAPDEVDRQMTDETARSLLDKVLE